jgi:hypothetical protein
MRFTMQHGMTNEREYEAEADLDLVWGVEAISQVIRQTKRQTSLMIERGELDGVVRRIGRRYYASRQGLRRHFLGKMEAE